MRYFYIAAALLVVSGLLCFIYFQVLKPRDVRVLNDETSVTDTSAEIVGIWKYTDNSYPDLPPFVTTTEYRKDGTFAVRDDKGDIQIIGKDSYMPYEYPTSATSTGVWSVIDPEQEMIVIDEIHNQSVPVSTLIKAAGLSSTVPVIKTNDGPNIQYLAIISVSSSTLRVRVFPHGSSQGYILQRMK